MPNEKKQHAPAKLQGLVSELSTKLQKRVSDTAPSVREMCNAMDNHRSLKNNLTILLTNGLRKNEVNWDEEEFEDFFILIETLDLIHD